MKIVTSQYREAGNLVEKDELYVEGVLHITRYLGGFNHDTLDVLEQLAYAGAIKLRYKQEGF